MYMGPVSVWVLTYMYIRRSMYFIVLQDIARFVNPVQNRTSQYCSKVEISCEVLDCRDDFCRI